jgi:hypothetical protein
MHVFLEEIGAFIAAVSVEYSEVAAPGPASLEIGFGDVHDDGDAVFVVVLDESVEGIDAVALDGAVGSLYEFGWFDLGYACEFLLVLMIHSCFNDNNNLN